LYILNGLLKLARINVRLTANQIIKKLKIFRVKPNNLAVQVDTSQQL